MTASSKAYRDQIRSSLKTTGCIGELYFVASRDGNISSMNLAAEKILSGKRGGAHPVSIKRIFDRKTKKAFERSFRELTNREDSLSFTGKLNNNRSVDVHLNALQNAILVTIRDLSEVHKQEEELRELRQILQLIFNSAPVGLIYLDAQGLIHCLSPWIPHKLGVQEKNHRDIIGRSFAEVSIGQVLHLGDFTQKLLNGQSFKRLKIQVKNRLGNTRVALDVEGVPIFSSAGKVSGALIVLEDITTMEALSDQVSQSQLLETTGAITGSMTIELQCLLGTLLSQICRLQTRINADSPLYDAINSIESSVLKIIEYSSRLQPRISGHSENIPQKDWLIKPIDVNSIIRDVSRILQQAIDRQITLSLELDNSIPCLLADRLQIQRALFHLLTNACEAMPHGGNITIRTKAISAEEAELLDLQNATDGAVRISIQDTGMGMTNEVKANLFRPFYSTKTEKQLAGLGLFTVSRIVKAYGGTVKVDSQVGRGSTVSLTFPSSAKGLKPEDSTHKHEPAGHILLLDDETALRKLGKKLLEAGGYRVSAFSKDKEALNFYRNNHRDIDLILYNVAIPERDESEFINQIFEINHEAKVLLSSGCISEDSLDPEIMTKASGFIPQPYRKEALVRKVKEAIYGEMVPAGTSSCPCHPSALSAYNKSDP